MRTEKTQTALNNYALRIILKQGVCGQLHANLDNMPKAPPNVMYNNGMDIQVSFDNKHAETFWNEWQASDYTLQQLFFLLLEPYVPGSGRMIQATDDILDLAYQLGGELTNSQQWDILIAQGIFANPSNPNPEEIHNIMRLSHFMTEHRQNHQYRSTPLKVYPLALINNIKEMTVDWPN